MNITTNPGVESTVVVLEGQFDAHEAPHAMAVFDETIDGGQANIQVSLADVHFIDSTAIAELEIGIALWPLLDRQLVVDALALRGVVLDVETDAEGLAAGL